MEKGVWATGGDWKEEKERGLKVETCCIMYMHRLPTRTANMYLFNKVKLYPKTHTRATHLFLFVYKILKAFENMSVKMLNPWFRKGHLGAVDLYREFLSLYQTFTLR